MTTLGESYASAPLTSEWEGAGRLGRTIIITVRLCPYLSYAFSPTCRKRGNLTPTFNNQQTRRTLHLTRFTVKVWLRTLGPYVIILSKKTGFHFLIIYIEDLFR